MKKKTLRDRGAEALPSLLLVPVYTPFSLLSCFEVFSCLCIASSLGKARNGFPRTKAVFCSTLFFFFHWWVEEELLSLAFFFVLVLFESLSVSIRLFVCSTVPSFLPSFFPFPPFKSWKVSCPFFLLPGFLPSFLPSTLHFPSVLVLSLKSLSSLWYDSIFIPQCLC